MPEAGANANELCFVTCLNIQEFRACLRPFAEAQYVWQYVDSPINIDGAYGMPRVEVYRRNTGGVPRVEEGGREGMLYIV